MKTAIISNGEETRIKIEFTEYELETLMSGEDILLTFNKDSIVVHISQVL